MVLRLKSIFLIISMLMVSAVLSLSAAAEGEIPDGLSLTGPDGQNYVSTVTMQREQYVDVNIHIPAAPSDAANVWIKLYYDKSVFSVTDCSLKPIFAAVPDITAEDHWQFNDSGSDNGNTYFSLVGAYDVNTIPITTDVDFTLRLQVKRTARKKHNEIILSRLSAKGVDAVSGESTGELWGITEPDTVYVDLDDLPPSSSTDGRIYVTDTGNNEINTVTPSQEFYVDIDVPAMPTLPESMGKLNNANIEVEYDPSVFKFIGWENKALTPDTVCEETQRDSKHFGLAISNTPFEISSPVTLKAKMQVLDDVVSGEHSIKLSSAKITFDDLGEPENLWTPLATASAVTVDIDSPLKYPTEGGGISADVVQVKRGNNVKVTLTIPKIIGKVEAADVIVEYNPTAFQLVEWNPGFGSRANGSSYYGITMTGGDVDLSSGNTTLTATFKANSNAADGTYDFHITSHRLMSSRHTDMWQPTVTSTSVTIPNEQVTPTPTPVETYPVSGEGISINKTQVLPGDVFDVSVTLPRMSITADSAYFEIKYDPSVFEVLSTDRGSLETGSNYFGMNIRNATSLTNGLTVTAKVKARATAYKGNYSFQLQEYDVLSGYKQLWTPTRKTAYVSVDAVSSEFPVRGGGISLSTSSVRAGETFNAYITVPAITATTEEISIRAEFDANEFEVVSWNQTVSGLRASYGYGYFDISTSGTYNSFDLRNGCTFTATLRARQNAYNGNYIIRLSNTRITDRYGQIEMWLPNTTTAGITVWSGSVTGYDPWLNPIIDNRSRTEATTIIVDSPTTKVNNSDDDTTRPAYNDDVIDDDDGDDSVDVDDGGSGNGGSSGRYDYYDDTASTPDGAKTVALDAKLNGVNSKRITVTTKRSFFEGSTIIYLRHTDEADSSGRTALRSLGYQDCASFMFDISVYDTLAGKYIHSLPNGYIDFKIPVPPAVSANPGRIQVYHTAGGYPEQLDSNIVFEDGMQKVHFRASEFSPYMFVDPTTTARDAVVIISDETNSGGTGSTGGSGGNSGSGSGNGGSGQYTPVSKPANPHTGFAAAMIIVPSAMVGCVLLAKKDKRKRSSRRR